MANGMPAAPPKRGNGNGSRRASADISAPEMSSGKPGPRALSIVLYTQPGWGKTTTSAYATDPGLIMGRGETGYLTLLDSGLVPDIPRAEVTSWTETLALLRDIANADEQRYKVLGLDTTGALERLCHEYVRDQEYDGSDKKFWAYQQGPSTAVNEWLKMLQILDRIREEQNTSILLLGHVKVRKSRNPTGEDFDQATLDVHKDTLATLRRWSDAVLYGEFLTQAKQEGLRTKGEGGHQRVLFCQNDAAHIAKNRLNLPDRIVLDNDPSENWSAIRNAIMEGKHDA